MLHWLVSEATGGCLLPQERKEYKDGKIRARKGVLPYLYRSVFVYQGQHSAPGAKGITRRKGSARTKVARGRVLATPVVKTHARKGRRSDSVA